MLFSCSETGQKNVKHAQLGVQVRALLHSALESTYKDLILLGISNILFVSISRQLSD